MGSNTSVDYINWDLNQQELVYLCMEDCLKIRILFC